MSHIILTQQERDRFADYLRQEAETEKGLADLVSIEEQKL